MSLHLKNMSKGQSFYECGYGQCIEGVLLEEPTSHEVVIGGVERIQWRCKADYKGRTIDLTVTEGLEHYGPKLHETPAYVRVQ